MNQIKLGDNLTKEDLRHYTADYAKRTLAKGHKMPAPPRDPTPLEIAYRAQSSRIFKQAPYERPGQTYDQMMLQLPNRSMGLENPGFKTSEFQPTKPASSIPESQYSIDLVRNAHMTAGRNASQMGYPITKATYPLDQSYGTPMKATDNRPRMQTQDQQHWNKTYDSVPRSQRNKRTATEEPASYYAFNKRGHKKRRT